MKRFRTANVLFLSIHLVRVITFPGVLWAKQATNADRAFQALAGREDKPVDFKTLISAAELKRELEKRTAPTVVDVREPADYRRSRMPGSKNVPLFALKTKTYLRNRPIVLVNAGYDYHRLARELPRLAKEGFKSVRILRGGLVAWLQAGGKLSGDAFAIKDLNKVSPREFFPNKHYGAIEVFELHGREGRAGSKTLPQAMALPMMKGRVGSAMVAMTVSDLVERKRGKVLYVLITARRDVLQELEPALLRSVKEPVFFLQGGVEGYEAFLKEQVRMWLGGRIVTKGCPTCQ